jgi:hypothetical protein
MVRETVTLADQSWTATVFVYDGSQVALQFDSSGTSGTPGTLAAADLSHRYLWGPAVDQLLADEQVTTPSQAGPVVWPLAPATDSAASNTRCLPRPASQRAATRNTQARQESLWRA